MKINEHKHESVCHVGKSYSTTIENEDDCEDDPYGQILREPHRTIDRIDGEDETENGIGTEKPMEEFRVFLHIFKKG
jgi:hypothetical protein